MVLPEAKIIGMGDEIIATARARAMHKANGLPVVIVGRNGLARWSPIWENNPRILREPIANCNRLPNGGGAGRPYIAGKTSTHWIWKTWEREPGEIYLYEHEKRFAEPYSGKILVEPNTKVVDGNKAWSFDRWASLVSGREEVFLQVGPPGIRVLPGVQHVVTTFREACAVLAASRAFVGTEGALHHAAAALGVPAVVLWSEFISPEITGYASQVNLRRAGSPCGSRLPCGGCKVSMHAIEVEEVEDALEGIL